MAKSSVPKTNAMRVLDAAKVAYEVFSYSSDIHGAKEAAEVMGVPPEIVYKTLVVLPESGKGRAMLVIVPGSKELSLKVLGQSVGEKKLRMASQKEAEQLTGLLVGGISPLALLQKGFNIFIDKAALDLEVIHISAGQRGINLRLARQDLVRVTKAVPVEC
jgi:Cys-tRNA(Pro)/Cys-tRNA(Cys) deacylase